MWKKGGKEKEIEKDFKKKNKKKIHLFPDLQERLSVHSME